MEEKLKNELFPKFFTFFENMLKENGGSGYFTDSSVTAADLYLYDSLQTAQNIVPDCLSAFPLL